MTASGTTSSPATIVSAVAPSSEKWIGASRWVPACSMIFHQFRLKPSFLKSYCFCSSMPGTPKKVGKSGDMVWVRSTTPLK